MQMMFLNAEKKTMEPVSANTYADYYNLLGCSTVDSRSIIIEGYEFVAICDDEALFVRNPRLSAVSESMESLMYGNLLIAGLNTDGDYTDLTEEEVAVLKNCCRVIPTRLHPDGCLMLTKIV